MHVLCFLIVLQKAVDIQPGGRSWGKGNSIKPSGPPELCLNKPMPELGHTNSV